MADELYVFVAKKAPKLKVAVGRSKPRQTLEGHMKPGSMIFAQFENYEFRTTDRIVAEALVANSRYGITHALVSDEAVGKLGLGQERSKLIAADEKRKRTVKSSAIETVVQDEIKDHIEEEDLEIDNEENAAIKIKEYIKGESVIYKSKEGDVEGIVVEDLESKVRIRKDDNGKIVRVAKEKVKSNPNRKAAD